MATPGIVCKHSVVIHKTGSTYTLVRAISTGNMQSRLIMSIMGKSVVFIYCFLPWRDLHGAQPNGSFGPLRTNSISIGSAVLQGSLSWPLGRHTDRPRYMCNNRPLKMICGLLNGAISRGPWATSTVILNYCEPRCMQSTVVFTSVTLGYLCRGLAMMSTL